MGKCKLKQMSIINRQMYEHMKRACRPSYYLKKTTIKNYNNINNILYTYIHMHAFF